MKDPAIIFYTSDFLMGVSNLTMEERGQYITLLCLEHQQGHLSKKIIDLNISNVSQDVLEKFNIDEEGKYYNERLEYEINKRSKFIEHQIENGKKGGRPKKPKENPKETQTITQIKAKQKPLENENEIENIIDNVIVNENIKKLFREYIDIRKKNKYTITESVVKRLIKKLNEYGTTEEEKEEVIMKAITGKWQDFYPLKEKEQKNNNSNVFEELLKEEQYEQTGNIINAEYTEKSIS